MRLPLEQRRSRRRYLWRYLERHPHRRLARVLTALHRLDANDCDPLGLRHLRLRHHLREVVGSAPTTEHPAQRLVQLVELHRAALVGVEGVEERVEFRRVAVSVEAEQWQYLWGGGGGGGGGGGSSSHRCA